MIQVTQAKPNLGP